MSSWPFAPLVWLGVRCGACDASLRSVPEGAEVCDWLAFLYDSASRRVRSQAVLYAWHCTLSPATQRP